MECDGGVTWWSEYGSIRAVGVLEERKIAGGVSAEGAVRAGGEDGGGWEGSEGSGEGWCRCRVGAAIKHYFFFSFSGSDCGACGQWGRWVWGEGGKRACGEGGGGGGRWGRTAWVVVLGQQ